MVFVAIHRSFTILYANLCLRVLKPHKHLSNDNIAQPKCQRTSTLRGLKPFEGQRYCANAPCLQVARIGVPQQELEPWHCSAKSHLINQRSSKIYKMISWWKKTRNPSVEYLEVQIIKSSKTAPIVLVKKVETVESIK